VCTPESDLFGRGEGRWRPTVNCSGPATGGLAWDPKIKMMIHIKFETNPEW